VLGEAEEKSFRRWAGWFVEAISWFWGLCGLVLVAVLVR